LSTLRLTLVLVTAAAALAVGATAGGAQTSAARLTLDGIAFKPEYALTPSKRARGLMERDPAPADGMLFVFPYPTTSGFWMQNTLVPLRIVFFKANGAHVKTLLMKPCVTDPCKVYYPRRLYRFALELRATDRRPAKVLGPVSELRRLISLSF
jgi:uncharacterized membrane protein (UPF0127 family)